MLRYAISAIPHNVSLVDVSALNGVWIWIRTVHSRLELAILEICITFLYNQSEEAPPPWSKHTLLQTPKV